ncbi:hypothetical protein PVAP13_2KG260358 [Panicum virgatum]|uniref:Uncharacterized protein n=1 Tax=Panicum virgatum TaxID=38727 RepID=A0A8T0W439_PANVG|nr:hypothetical protein PVAP13_2KG260358 [Panicum virgatum]
MWIKKLNVIDPSPVPKWCEGNTFRKYKKTLTHFYQNYMAAMNVHCPRWDGDIYKWSFTREKILKDATDILRATWFYSTYLRGKVLKARKFIRTSSSMCWLQT